MLDSQYNPSAGALNNKLVRLAQQLDARILINKYSTQDEFFLSLTQTLWDFYRYLRAPRSQSLRISYKDLLSPRGIFSILEASVNDIQEGYDRIAETQNEILRRNNRYASFTRDIRSRIQHANNITSAVSRGLEDNTYEVSDSFADETLLDGPSAGGQVLYTNPVAGVLTLPQLDTTEPPIANVKILGSSNGVVSNTHPLKSLTDSNNDTWFEYSRSGESDNDPLILEFLVTLQTVQIINQIQIFPLGLDDRAFPQIIDISTSLDGRAYQTIRDSIPTFLSKEEEDALFILGPVGFRNQDHADFTFTPRTCQYIRIKIQQGKRVLVNQSQILRIALRDIHINQVTFQDKGEITSKVYPLEFTPRKLKLVERAVETNPLTSIIYQVSFDEGAQWYDITADTDYELNTGAANSIDVPGKLSSIKLKIIGERNKAKFNGLAKPLAASVRTISTRVNINGVPSELTFENIPLADSVLVTRPVASIGTDFGYPIAKANGEPNLVVDMPIAIRPFSEIVKLNGQAWTRVANFDNGLPSSQWYTIDYAKKKIKFSDARNAMLPEGDISLQLDAEQVLLPDTSPVIVDLTNAHDFNAEHTSIYWYDRIRFSKEEALARGATSSQLSSYPVINSVDVTVDVPRNQYSFYLNDIPDVNSPLVFSDTSRFKTLVAGTPSAGGEYSITPLVSGVISPVRIETYTRTDSNSAGTVSFQARAHILSPTATYNPDLWLNNIGYPSFSSLTNMLDIYYPRFSDSQVFALEKTFIDGATELTKAGEYSIDYENGVVYNFANTEEQGITAITHGYQLRKKLNWEFIATNPKQLLIRDDSFLVTQNNQNLATLTNQDGSFSYVTFKDSRYIRVPIQSDGSFTDLDTNKIITYQPDDLIRGYVLPNGRTRVRLEHGTIVRNSIRFTFLSDDINAFDNRIVVKNTDGSISTNPEPIRDAYGNALGGVEAGARTQRDVDKLTLVTEKIYIDGQRELQGGGDYSIDYINGILFTYNSIPAHTIIQYEYADVRVSYVATQVLRQDEQYSLDLANLSLKIISLGSGTDLESTDLLVRYDVIDELKEDPNKIYQYYSPILMGYQLKLKP